MGPRRRERHCADALQMLQDWVWGVGALLAMVAVLVFIQKCVLALQSRRHACRSLPAGYMDAGKAPMSLACFYGTMGTIYPTILWILVPFFSSVPRPVRAPSLRTDTLAASGSIPPSRWPASAHSTSSSRYVRGCGMRC